MKDPGDSTEELCLLVGVISLRPEGACDVQDGYHLFTTVFEFRDWIDDIMETWGNN